MGRAAAPFDSAMGSHRNVTSTSLLSDSTPTLTSFALSNVLLAFDYDGTLAPIASTPARARMRRTTRALLQRVAMLYPCVVISGRALDDITRRLRHIPLWYVFGNHGSEPEISPHPTHLTREWVDTLRATLPPDPAIVVEDKKHSVTVHYRGARDRTAARDAVMQTAASLRDVRLVGGSEAINLLRRDAPDKGSALSYAVRAFACHTAIYVGDDETDEDAFTALPPERLLSVRIGPPPPASGARFHLASQREIDELLDRLITLRGPQPATG